MKWGAEMTYNSMYLCHASAWQTLRPFAKHERVPFTTIEISRDGRGRPHAFHGF